MAKVWLESDRGDVTDLPELCMKCGEPASVYKKRNFSWYPPWVAVLLLGGLIPFAIVALILTKKSRVEVPLCEQHKNHWLIRQLIVIGSLIAVLLFGIAATIGAAILSDQTGNDVAMPIVCVGGVFLFLGWVIVAIIAQNSSIRPREITEESITLTGVSDLFVEAYEAERPRSRRNLDELARERWHDSERRSRGSVRRQRDEDDEDDEEGPTNAYRKR